LKGGEKMLEIALLTNRKVLSEEIHQTMETKDTNSFSQVFQGKLGSDRKDLLKNVMKKSFLTEEEVDPQVEMLMISLDGVMEIPMELQSMFLKSEIDEKTVLSEHSEEEVKFAINQTIQSPEFSKPLQINEQRINQVIPNELSELTRSLGIEIEKVLHLIMSEQDVDTHKVKLLDLLKQFSNLVKEHPVLKNTQPIQLDDSKVQLLWEKFSNSFARRAKMNVSGKYSTEAKVDQKTFVQWLDQLVNDFGKQQAEVQPGKVDVQTPINVNGPMTKVEQFVIHMQQTEQVNTKTFEQQLLQKFEQAIRTSQFLRSNNGPNQLIFHLRPENLGDMTVRLIEINGEMTARILVSSEATRKALQSNLHQLKSMFAPHQVVIEKQEDLVVQQTEQEESQFEEESQDHQFFDREEQEKEDGATKETVSFEEIFRQKV